MAKQFTNQAELSYNGVRTLSNVAVGMLEGVLSVTKTAVQQEYSEGDVLTYVVSIVNNSGSDASGLTVSDDLGAYAFGTGTVQPLDYVNGSIQYYSGGAPQPAPTVAATSGLVISGITVPANSSVILVYSATVNAYAPLETGSTIDNTVTVDGAQTTAVTAEESVAVLSGAQLSLIKSVSPIPVAENGQLTYTFQLINSGNTAVLADDGAIITDVFDPLLTALSVSLDGAPLTAVTDYTYDATSGEFATLDGVIAIPSATYTQDPATGEWSSVPGSATLTVTGTVNPG